MARLESYHQIIEILADLEHQPWVQWSKTLAASEKLSEERLRRWRTLWKPYKKLSEETKEQDREWAKKVLDEVPIKCPVWQCGRCHEHNLKSRSGPVNNQLTLECHSTPPSGTQIFLGQFTQARDDPADLLVGGHGLRRILGRILSSSQLT